MSEPDLPRPSPCINYPGGKYALAPSIAPLLPADLERRLYREPFMGAGGMYFWLAGAGLAFPERSSLSDGWAPLVALHRAVAEDPEGLMGEIDVLVRTFDRCVAEGGGKACFGEMRAELNRRIASPVLLGEVATAALLVFINKTCFRGVMRTNRKGEFNTPFGFSDDEIAAARTANRSLVSVYDRNVIMSASRALVGCDISREDFEQTLIECALPGEVVYLDPPYVPASETSSFTSYGGAWRDGDHERLGELFRELDERGCLLVLSNSDTPRTRVIFKGYDIQEIAARRSIGARFANTDRTAKEILVRNLDRWPSSARRSEGP